MVTPMDLTPAVYRALSRANRLAQILPEWTAQARLIRALLQEDEGVAGQWLAWSGLRLPAYLAQFPWPANLTDDAEQPSALEEAETRRQWGRILRLARFQAREMGEPGEISSHHLLAALFSDESSLDSHVEALILHGLSVESLLSRLFPVPQRAVAMDGFVLEQPSAHSPPPPTPFIGGPVSTATLSDSLNSTQGMARIIDACANRAREGIRVVEDHARFLLNSTILTGLLKQTRHDLKSALDLLPDKLVKAGLYTRDVTGDVGTSLTTTGEMTRSDPCGVALANIKRVQESLRSLEESCKLICLPAAAALEALRYQTYRVEKVLVNLLEPAGRLARSYLYVLVGSRDCALGLEGTVRAALDGGADMIQSREKAMKDRDWLLQLEKLRRWTADAGALLIVNDRPDLALIAGADGAHVGQEDLPVNYCKRVLAGAGVQRLAGCSTHTPGQLSQAFVDGADHAGVGPVFPSGTKHFDSFPGLELVRAVSGMWEIPWFALGGVGPDNVSQVLDAGAKRVAVSRCVLASQTPMEICRKLKASLLSASR